MKHQKTNNLIKKQAWNYREFPKTKYEWLKKIGAISMSTFNLFLMF